MWRGDRTETSIPGDEPPVTGAVLGDVRKRVCYLLQVSIAPFSRCPHSTESCPSVCVCSCLLFSLPLTLSSFRNANTWATIMLSGNERKENCLVPQILGE